MIIDVTQADIDEAERRLNGPPQDYSRTRDCPVAIAASHVLGTEVRAGIHWFYYASGRTYHDYPSHVRNAINQYDNGGGMVPFSFEVED